MSTKKVPLEDNIVHPQASFVSPMQPTERAEAPPSYQQVVAATNEVILPTPYYVAPPAGNECALLLQFPCPDVDAVAQCFKANVPNTLLHGGKVLAFFPEKQFFPTHKTAALVIHFGADRTALSWLQNMKSSNPELVSRWMGMIADKKGAKITLPDNYTRYKCVSIVLMKIRPDFVESKEFTLEHSQLLKATIPPASSRHEVHCIVSSKPVFVCGDWSSYQAKASELNLSMSLYPTEEHRNGYVQEFTNHPDVRKYSELNRQKYTFIFSFNGPPGNVWRFQDL